jgi:hypothetical protein
MENLQTSPDVFDLIVDETAVTGWHQYIKQQPEGEAVDNLISFHRKHIAATMNMAAAADGGLFLTDIPDTDLTVLEVRIGQKCSIGLYSRSEASEIAGLILEILGASTTHH